MRKRGSRYRGVSWDKTNKVWTARVWKDAASHYAGRYRTEEDAARAYNVKAKELFGEYAWLNPVSDEVKAATL